MKIRLARKILRSGLYDPTRWGGGARADTHRRAMKRVEQFLGGYRGIMAMGRAMGLGVLAMLMSGCIHLINVEKGQGSNCTTRSVFLLYKSVNCEPLSWHP